MKISAKARYALAAAIKMAQVYKANECIALNDLAENLQISKIYLEQIFSLLKRGKIVSSVKGAQGGYFLSRPPQVITVYEILLATDSSLFIKTDQTVAESAPGIENAMQNAVFQKLDHNVVELLSEITLMTLVLEEEKYNSNYMYYL